MMKNHAILMLCAVLGVSSMSAHANDTQKINTVKRIYQHAKSQKSSVLDERDATPAFAKVIARQARYASRFDWDNNNPDDCVELAPALIEGNGYTIEDRHMSKFSVNKKGQVVAQLNFTEGGDSRMTFDLVCQGETCRVDDIVDSYGDSLKANILQYCPR